jgi:hypothetical protein
VHAATAWRDASCPDGGEIQMYRSRGSDPDREALEHTPKYHLLDFASLDDGFDGALKIPI